MKNRQCVGILVSFLLFFTSQIQSQSVRLVVTKKFRSFGLDEVRLKDREFKLRQNHDFDYIRTLEPDRYLSPFRRNAGIEVDSMAFRSITQNIMMVGNSWVAVLSDTICRPFP